MKEKLKAYWEYVVVPVGLALMYLLIVYAAFSLVFMQLTMVKL